MAKKRKKTKRSAREERLIKALKKKASVDNPWALAKAITKGTVDRGKAKRALGRVKAKRT